MGRINDVKSFLNYKIRKVIYELSFTVHNHMDRLQMEYIIISIASLKMHVLNYLNLIYFM